jgi:hypothetical protein
MRDPTDSLAAPANENSTGSFGVVGGVGEGQRGSERVANDDPRLMAPVAAESFDVSDVPRDCVLVGWVGSAAATLIESVDEGQRFDHSGDRLQVVPHAWAAVNQHDGRKIALFSARPGTQLVPSSTAIIRIPETYLHSIQRTSATRARVNARRQLTVRGCFWIHCPACAGTETVSFT